MPSADMEPKLRKGEQRKLVEKLFQLKTERIEIREQVEIVSTPVPTRALADHIKAELDEYKHTSEKEIESLKQNRQELLKRCKELERQNFKINLQNGSQKNAGEQTDMQAPAISPAKNVFMKGLLQAKNLCKSSNMQSLLFLIGMLAILIFSISIPYLHTLFPAFSVQSDLKEEITLKENEIHLYKLQMEQYSKTIDDLKIEMEEIKDKNWALSKKLDAETALRREIEKKHVLTQQRCNADKKVKQRETKALFP